MILPVMIVVDNIWLQWSIFYLFLFTLNQFITIHWVVHDLNNPFISLFWMRLINWTRCPNLYTYETCQFIQVVCEHNAWFFYFIHKQCVLFSAILVQTQNSDSSNQWNAPHTKTVDFWGYAFILSRGLKVRELDS